MLSCLSGTSFLKQSAKAHIHTAVSVGDFNLSDLTDEAYQPPANHRSNQQLLVPSQYDNAEGLIMKESHKGLLSLRPQRHFCYFSIRSGREDLL